MHTQQLSPPHATFLQELSMRIELLKTMCRGEHIDEVEALLQNYLLRIRREMQVRARRLPAHVNLTLFSCCQHVKVKAVSHKYIKDMHHLEVLSRAG